MDLVCAAAEPSAIDSGGTPDANASCKFIESIPEREKSALLLRVESIRERHGRKGKFIQRLDVHRIGLG